MLHTQIPQRIQRKRIRGWKKPSGTVDITRPGPLGNPFTLQAILAAGLADTRPAAQQMAVDAFAEWVPGGQEPDRLPLVDGQAKWKRLRAALPRIVGHNIMCFCGVDQPCHGDVLLPHARGLVLL
ncbi:DUF4326 domain-containing protein [Micromonospora lupini]|uniref:DUF4326 domain-containing protein n=1 Tax=Micromonospora lupini TaxID=285679 RepID=UPI00225BEEF3|nr:DUF4326 domain-containing protein [Micromonospora lupini]MCX5070846.1 DUF4326 domain-containing protein [Micromonospora lupini]